MYFFQIGASFILHWPTSRRAVKEAGQQHICKYIFFGEVESPGLSAIYLLMLMRTCRWKEVA